MKYGILFIASSLLLCTNPAPARAEIQTVPFVDVAKYLGDWYQVAHIPLWFEGIADCACARQRLSPPARAGVVGVLNTCTKTDGSLYSISGTASDDDSTTNAKFTVSFEGVPFSGSYWIIGLDANYRFAVVTDKGGDALYILSRTPHLDQPLYEEALRIANTQVDVSHLVVTSQEGCRYPE